MDFDTGLFLDALLSWPFLHGALLTVALSLASHGVGIVLGLGVALMGTSPRRPVRGLAAAYVWFFRGTPVLLLLLFVWNALPQVVPAFREDWFTPFLAAWLALSLNETAYQSEINRAALLAVDDGQRAAAAALGLTRLQAFLLVVLPQCLRVAVPPTVNEFITLLKTTSLASVISLQELLATTTRATSASFRYTEFYAVALVYYLAIVSLLTLGQARLERRLAVGEPRPGGQAKAH
ncbi:L-cystine transport system permease protein TcyL [Rhodovastum atsumiense]|uniref:Amino acid ABC transporter permease n=1 Tax=Rhodovastum atsumiense TaxID=504468 RepID=A0A5M6IMZ9_9PROT|nr:amino acid ABC transporter permease [Rhodovastum atsumiense]KAA5609249.1 amino acid ABC transporter permease [Rhodovastum atsumiense]CAH2601701.1 L-cystine transport system permease protein TcyL [Rhodovastum atsumiense]